MEPETDASEAKRTSKCNHTDHEQNFDVHQRSNPSRLCYTPLDCIDLSLRQQQIHDAGQFVDAPIQSQLRSQVVVNLLKNFVDLQHLTKDLGINIYPMRRIEASLIPITISSTFKRIGRNKWFDKLTYIKLRIGRSASALRFESAL